jgi:hypothetical protein
MPAAEFMPSPPSLDELIGTREHRPRHRQPERLRGLHVDRRRRESRGEASSGSAWIAMTIGIVDVARLAASGAGGAPATIMSTCSAVAGRSARGVVLPPR